MRTPPRTLSKRDILRAKKPRVTDFGNAWLYELCRRYPEHKIIGHCVAKVWLIGRAYSAAIERKAAPRGTDELFAKIGPPMCKSKLGPLLRSLPDGRSPLVVRLSRAVEVHEQLMKIWAKEGARGKRSLASKYLHFHRRDVFPMFDSRAARAIRKITPEARHVLNFPARSGDKVYREFCQRYLWLLQGIRRQFRSRLTLRQVDRLLLAIAAE